jgi:hypothetical protein
MFYIEKKTHKTLQRTHRQKNTKQSSEPIETKTCKTILRTHKRKKHTKQSSELI